MGTWIEVRGTDVHMQVDLEIDGSKRSTDSLGLLRPLALTS